MCGIGLLRWLKSNSLSDASLKSKFIESLSRRGPDSTSEFELINNFWMVGNVLHIQGKEGIIQQPLIDDFGNALLWNGEVFGETKTSTFAENQDSSDTVLISRLLCKSLMKETNIESAQYAASLVAITLSGIQGPYAFIYFHAKSSTLFFGRDPFGRRSLLTLKSFEDGSLKVKLLGLSSVIPIDFPPQHGIWEEVGVEGVYAINLDDSVFVVDKEIIHLAYWPESIVRLGRSKSILVDALSINYHMDTTVIKFLEVLKSAVRKRLRRLHINYLNSDSDKSTPTSPLKSNLSVPSLPRCRVGVLFSGGIDSVFLAALLHLCLLEDEVKQKNENMESPSASTSSREPIDLVNVTFKSESSHPSPTSHKLQGSKKINQESVDDGNEPKTTTTTTTISPDRLAAIAALGELQLLYPDRDWRLLHVDVRDLERETCQPHILQLISPSDTSMDLNIGTAFWFAARAEGYLRQYSAEDIASVYQTHCQGRPLLRRGGRDAARSVGLSEYQPLPQPQSRPRPTPRGSETQSQSRINNVIKCSDETIATLTSSLSCANIDCGKVSKRNCPFSLCRRCCLKHSSASASASLCSVSNNLEVAVEVVVESVFPIPSAIMAVCKVHKQKQNTGRTTNNISSSNSSSKEHTVSLQGNIEQQEEEGEEEQEKDDSFPTVVSVSDEDSPSNTSYPLVHNNGNTADSSNGNGTDSFDTSKSMSPLPPRGNEECQQSTAHPESKQILSLGNRDHTYPATTTTVTADSSEASIAANDSSDTSVAYRSAAKVLLVGLGADEQLGGYSRHRSCYQRGGEAALRNELAGDCERLWKRNLGRDDRCISDNGREAWFPYLDEDVVAFIQSLPLQAIVDLSLPPGEGDKLVLRQAARQLGLGDSTTLVKRAIQFGSRIAQRTNSRHFGSNRKGQGKTKISELSTAGVGTIMKVIEKTL